MIRGWLGRTTEPVAAAVAERGVDAERFYVELLGLRLTRRVDREAFARRSPERADELVLLQSALRSDVKRLSRTLRPSESSARRLLYRALYGSRAALEEVLLQMRPEDMPVLSRGEDEPSAAPSAELRGVRVHSGDILVSRGGAPTSALIARGNDYPGNFSHVALLYVSPEGEVETATVPIVVALP